MQFLPPATLSEAGCETFNLLPPGAQPTAGWRAAMVLATLAVTKVARSRWSGTSSFTNYDQRNRDAANPFFAASLFRYSVT